MKKLLSLLLVAMMLVGLLAGCGTPASTPTDAPSVDDGGDATVDDTPDVELTATQKIIAEAETMTLEELAAKAIEESNGATFFGVGNSSRGKTALPLFIEYLQSIDPSYTLSSMTGSSRRTTRSSTS